MRPLAAFATMIAVVALAFLGTSARGQAGGDEELPDVVRIKITDPTRDLIRIAVPQARGGGRDRAMVADVLARDLQLSGYFRVLDPKSFLANLSAEGLNLVPASWMNVGAQWVTKAQITPSGGSNRLELRLYQPSKGADAVLRRTYTARAGRETRRSVHDFATRVVKLITDQDSFFNSRIAFASPKRRRREIYTMDFDGHGVAQVTSMRSVSMLPAISPGGGKIAFTSFARDNPDLWIVSAAGGRARRTCRYPGLNSGAAWSPDGSRLALALSKDGNAEIYLVRPSNCGIIARLTSNRAIDISPSFSPDGSQLAFVSDRQGSPQIYVMSARGGAAQRLTFRGSYNQTPRWCPNPKTPLIAFTGRDERGRYDIFTVDAKSRKIARLTQGYGSSFDPAWAPNGRRLAFANTGRGGVWLVSPDGSSPVQISKQGATNLSWGRGR